MVYDYAVLYVLTDKNHIKGLPPSCFFEGRNGIRVWAESVWMEGRGQWGKGL